MKVQYNRLLRQSEHFQNPRTSSGLDPESIRELAISIGWHGLLSALIVAPVDPLGDGGYVITAGQRRYLAIGYLIEHAEELAAEVDANPADWRRRADRLKNAVPCRASETIDHDGVAMADNLGRVDLSSYEITAAIARMHTDGSSGSEIAHRICKSPSYVSKALKAWRGASEALKEAWRDGLISLDRVKELADLHEEDQERALAGGKPRGGHGRPGIDAVKDALDGAERKYGAKAAPESYARAVLDALRWVSGQQSSAKFAEFMETIES